VGVLLAVAGGGMGFSSSLSAELGSLLLGAAPPAIRAPVS